MYNEIVGSYLKSLRALKLYVENVDRVIMESYKHYFEGSNDKLFALLMNIALKLKENEVNVEDLSIKNIERSIGDISKEVTTISNAIRKISDDFITEKDMNGKKIYEIKALPKKIRDEYKIIEAEDNQSNILYSGSLLLLITYFENLISGIFKHDFMKHPERISLETKPVSYKLLAEIGNIEAIKEHIIDDEVTSIMYKSINDWKDYFIKTIKLKLDYFNKNFNRVKEIIARRNLYVHNNGIINSIYVNISGNTHINTHDIGKNIGISKSYVQKAINVIEYAGVSIILEIWLKEYGKDNEEIDKISGIIFEEYLIEGEWEAARIFYDLCLSYNKLSNSDELMFRINKWQCYKWLGEYDKIKEEVDKIDISACKPMYVLGILALQDKYDEFFDLFDKQSDIDESCLHEWPLFMKVRECDEYINRYVEDMEVKNEILEEYDNVNCANEETIS